MSEDPLVDQAGAALDQRSRDPLDLAPDGMVLAAELDPQGVLHLGWVPDGTGGYRGEMAVYVKPSGLLGTAYMAAIKPFRYVIVYPALMRQLEREWRERGDDEPGGSQ